ncbi:MAG: type I CRISPR-associated protein Cas7 [Candidatus Aenigmarchaeota archaeon]|nr:type I CRISPR-associated protein Cas7 [Candidatus Aenigmarchaeota archaeon]
MDKKEFNNWAVGISVVRSINGNFNADISRMPRTLPDKKGTIYATDKALKYCIRNYLVNAKKAKVFMWRRQNDKREPLNIDENFNVLFKKDPKRSTREEILNTLLTCIDVRLFGCTYAGEKNNIAIHGTTQISYGVNGIQDNLVYSNQILSPFQNLKKGDTTQATMGDESKALDVCYVYDYNINPNNIGADNEQRLTEDDVETFKEALCRGVNSVNTTTKIGSETLLVVYVELNKPKMLQNLKKLIQISKDNEGNVAINITKLVEYLKKFDGDIVKSQIFHEKEKTNVVNEEKWGKLKETDLFGE